MHLVTMDAIAEDKQRERDRKRTVIRLHLYFMLYVYSICLRKFNIILYYIIYTVNITL